MALLNKVYLANEMGISTEISVHIFIVWQTDQSRPTTKQWTIKQHKTLQTKWADNTKTKLADKMAEFNLDISLFFFVRQANLVGINCTIPL